MSIINWNETNIEFIRCFHQSRFTIYDLRITISFKEYLLWFLFQLANWGKIPVLDQKEVCFLSQLLKLRKICGKNSETNWWKHLMNSLRITNRCTSDRSLWLASKSSSTSSLCEFPVPVLDARLEYENEFYQFRLIEHFMFGV